MSKIVVIGLGYIGLPTAGMFAHNGHEVVGVDISPYVVNTINKGEIHLEEPGLAEFIRECVEAGNLRGSLTPESADAFIIAVPTPMLADKQADLSYVEAATKTLVPYLKTGDLVVLESTVPPMTTEKVVGDILREGGLDPLHDLNVVHSPERVLPGRIMTELVENDRVIGGLTAEASQLAYELYKSFVKGDIHLTDATTAEMVKLMENTTRDVNIALANQFAIIAEQLNVNVWEAIEFANRHPRINILKPGPGVGGHCIAIDPWFLIHSVPLVPELLVKARQLNDFMPSYVSQKVLDLSQKHSIVKPKVAALGLAYKADVDDPRESPAIEVIHQLMNAGCEVAAYDPFIQTVVGVPCVESLEAAVQDADCILVLTDHAYFQELIPAQFVTQLSNPIVVDTRHCLPHD
ncbi:MAG: nucleotide sugar dehydrogenase, partial [Anaerolineales bacterium]|nr:nucleotide sugar dehydrogenase [Anaerolineales bacterium]